MCFRGYVHVHVCSLVYVCLLRSSNHRYYGSTRQRIGRRCLDEKKTFEPRKYGNDGKIQRRLGNRQVRREIKALFGISKPFSNG